MDNLKQTLIDNLQKSGERLEKVAKRLNDNTREMVNYEIKVSLIKARLVASADIVGLPNQAMRDAEIENRLLTDQLYEPEYRKFLELKTMNKVLYTEWVLIQELNKNNRTLLMAGE